MKKYDAREVERYEVLAELSVLYEGSSEQISTHVANLSIGGMFIHTSKSFPESSILKLRFRLRRIGFVVNVRAEVRHRIPDKGVGVEFLDLTPEARGAIEQELGLPEASARRLHNK